MEKTKVAILMATYNGAKFIEEQLDSIINQHFEQWDLYIQDDFSNDNTPQILQDFARKDKRIHILQASEKMGAKNNFAVLMQKVEADYYFFADQDDIWFPSKMDNSLSKMKVAELNNPNRPIIVHSDLKVVDESLSEIDPSLWNMLRINPSLLQTFESMAAHCLLTGCTMLINHKAKEVSLPIPQEALMHDVWIGLMTLKHNGLILELDYPTILYRQHGNNTLGAKDYRINYLLQKVRYLYQTVNSQWKYYRMLKRAGCCSLWSFYKQKYKYYKSYNSLTKI